LIAILMAATAATPLAAQDWHGRNHDNGEQRSERAEQRQERQEARQQRQESQQQVQQVQQAQPQRFERQQQSENRGNWGGRRDFQQQQVQQQQQAVQVQQQEQVRAERFRGRDGGGWNGNRDQDNASRFAAEREASRRSAEQTIGGSFARQAAENERRYEQQTLRREQRDGRRWDGNRNDNRRWDGNRNDGRRWDGNRNDHRDWNRNWRNDNRYDWQRYRYQNRRIFSLGRYYAPYGGYGYNRLNIGIILGEAFFGRDYWIDPYYYHLPPAPPGTAWVRYYNDVVLVDVYSGEVIDVIYDFFW